MWHPHDVSFGTITDKCCMMFSANHFAASRLIQLHNAKLPLRQMEALLETILFLWNLILVSFVVFHTRSYYCLYWRLPWVSTREQSALPLQRTFQQEANWLKRNSITILNTASHIPWKIFQLATTSTSMKHAMAIPSLVKWVHKIGFLMKC